MFTEMLKYFIQWIKEEGWKFFLIVFILLAILLKILPKEEKPLENPVVPSSTTQVHPQVSTGITIKPKEKPTDPDLKITQKYTAQVNGKTVEVPLSTPKETLTKDNQVVVTQTLDVSAAVKPLLPWWSIGVGVGRYGRETYIPVSITRHYKPAKRSLQFTIKYSIDKRKINGGEIQHLWNF